MTDLTVNQMTAQSLSNMHLKLATLYSQLMLTKTDKERRKLKEEIFSAQDFIRQTSLLYDFRDL